MSLEEDAEAIIAPSRRGLVDAIERSIAERIPVPQLPAGSRVADAAHVHWQRTIAGRWWRDDQPDDLHDWSQVLARGPLYLLREGYGS